MTLQLSNTIIQTLLWILITYVLIRYVQDILYIERQYIYLGKLEEEISASGSINIFECEGKNYQKNYPIVLNLIDLFYKMLMPVLFTTINSIRIFKEWMVFNKVTIALICDTVLFVAIFIITWFYFFEIHSKTTALLKKYIPLINIIAEKLRKILKNV